MKQTILVAGGTGNLGRRIIRELLQKDVAVRAIVRKGTSTEKIQALRTAGAEVRVADMLNVDEVMASCAGVACVVSALQGLRDVIVDIQKTLLDAAVRAGVQGFIPSDYSTDYTDLPAGENRNFDLRRAFRQHLDEAPIRATSVFNGAFADILTYNTPLLNLRQSSVGYWGEKAGWAMDFTTMDDTAAFTAAAALDVETPRDLRIASFRVSPQQIQELAEKASSKSFKLISLGNLEDFAAQIRQQRAENPAGEAELYPRWQSGQYMLGQFSTHHASLDNDRYPGIAWTGAEAFIRSIV